MAEYCAVNENFEVSIIVIYFQKYSDSITAVKRQARVALAPHPRHGIGSLLKTHSPTCQMSILRRVVTVAMFGTASAFPNVAQTQACQSIAGNVVENCGFESTDLGAGPTWAIVPTTSWVSSTSAGVEVWAGAFDGFAASEGRNHAELNAYSPTSLWQHVNTVAGSRYDLGFAAAHREHHPVSGTYSQIDVYIDGHFLFSTGEMTTGYHWHDFSSSFFATSETTKLEFRGMGNGGSYGNHLDNVSAVAVASAVSTVPEPSTYALTAIGLAALGFASRRRRTR